MGTLRLFASYVVSRLLWTLNGNTKRKHTAGSDQQGPLSLHCRSSSPTVTRKHPIILPENRYHRRTSHGGTVMHMVSMSPSVTKKTPIDLSHNRYHRRTSHSGTVMRMVSMSPPVTKKTSIVLPETRLDDTTRSEDIVNIVSISDI